MRLLVVNYHYIGPEDAYDFPGIHSTSVERFRRQIEILRTAFRFIGQDDLLNALAGGGTLPEQACMLTFDDGLRSQYDLAVPIVQEYAIPAVFFVNGMPLAEAEPLSIHKLHWCRAHLHPDVFWQRVTEHFARLTGRAFSDEDFAVTEAILREQYPYDESLSAARVKYVLSRDLIDWEVREKIVDAIFDTLVDDPRAFCAATYLDRAAIIDLSRLGHALGVHTYSHLSQSVLGSNAERAEQEVLRCLYVLQSIPAAAPTVAGISYPYGHVTPSVVEAAERAGLRYGTTIEIAFNRTLSYPFLLSRLDANDIPEGKDPKFIIRDRAVEIIDERCADRRSRYGRE